MGVTKMERLAPPPAPDDNQLDELTAKAQMQLPQLTAAVLESSSDNDNDNDNEWGQDESDWRSSSSSDAPPRFSLVALPSRVRASVFRRPVKLQKPRRTKERSSTADTTRTSSASSTPRDSVLMVRQPSVDSENGEKFRTFWDEKLRNTMDKLAANLSKSDGQTPMQSKDVFHLLLKLYAHQDVVEELYSSYETDAAELEFYIPQLCTFLLHGNYAKQHQLECFLMSRSGESLPFAHRLTWFLRSFCNDAREYQSEYLSVTASPDQENSDLITAIGMRAGVPALLMNNGLCAQEVSPAKPGNLEQRRSCAFPVDKDLDAAQVETDESFAGHLLSKRCSIEDEARTDEGNAQQFTLFKQTPKFVEALTDLADELIPMPRPERNTELRRGLKQIQDRMLPSDVIYLPVGNSYHRVKAIQVEECFTFSTKERVPYFLCVEVLDYSVATPAASSKKRRRRKSRSWGNHSRSFCLKLPFKKSGAEAATPVEDSQDNLEEGLVNSTPANEQILTVVSPNGSALPDIEEENTPVVSDSSARAQKAKEAVAPDLLDGEDGDDEREEVEQGRRKSLLEDADLQRVPEDQQERMGQWSIPRSRRRSIKEYSSSASARSGGQFDSFYSSWFSKKQRDDDGDFSDFEVDAEVDDEGKVVERADTKHVVTTEDSSSHSTVEAAAAPTAPGAGVFSLFSRKQAATTESEPAETSGKLSNPVAPAHGAGMFSSLFSTKTENQDDSSAKSQGELKREETISSSSEGATSVSTEGPTAAFVDSAGIFASLFSKKPKTNPDSSAVTPHAASVSSLELSEEASMNSIDGEDADGEESDSKEALPSDTEVFVDDSSSLEPSEGRVSDDLDAEDADSEGTDSEVLASDSEGIVGPVPEPTTQSVSKPSSSFASWFARKPVPEVESTAVPEAKEEALETCLATADGGDIDDLTVSDSELAVISDDAFASSFASPSKPAAANDGRRSPQSVPTQRCRDLSISLDFADPSAWKDKFDLDDGLTDDEPDAEAPDTGAVASSGAKDGNEAQENDDDKPMIVFRERWSEKEARIRRESPFGDHPGWRLLSVIVKSNDDLRQEQFAAQLIAQCDRIFREYSLPLALRPYNVIATSATTGLIETVPDTVSLDSLKRNDPDYTTLLDFYHRLHGDKDTASFARAQRNFVESLAAYSMVCYVFQIKDRHNGNILVDTAGHVIHIDFGFLLTNSPGSNWNFERAPFKLTDEFVELMGGPRSSTFRYFRSLCIRAYLALRRNMDQIVLLVEMMLVGNDDLPCFAGGKKAVIEGLRARLKPGARTSACQVFVNQLIDQSINNWRTRWYDKYQRACLGIL